MKLIYAAEGATLGSLQVTAIRFAIMAVAAQVVLARSSTGSDQSDDTTNSAADSGTDGVGGFWLRAAELGFWGCAGTQLNSLGLQELSAVRATLLLATVNILTPALSALVGSTVAQRTIAPRTWLACVLALASTALAVAGGGATSFVASISLSDGYVLGAAAAYAMAKVRLGSFVNSYPPSRLAAGRLTTQALISFAILGGSSLLATAAGGGVGGGGGVLSFALERATELGAWLQTLSASQIGLLTLSALLPGVLATLLQAEGQKVIPAASAQPIYAAMPIFAAGWAFLLLHEPITFTEIVGGIGTCAAALLAATVPPSSAPREQREDTSASAEQRTQDAVGRVVSTAALHEEERASSAASSTKREVR